MTETVCKEKRTAQSEIETTSSILVCETKWFLGAHKNRVVTNDSGKQGVETRYPERFSGRAVDIHSEIPLLVLSESDALASREIFYALRAPSPSLPSLSTILFHLFIFDERASTSPSAETLFTMVPGIPLASVDRSFPPARCS